MDFWLQYQKAKLLHIGNPIQLSKELVAFLGSEFTDQNKRGIFGFQSQGSFSNTNIIVLCLLYTLHLWYQCLH